MRFGMASALFLPQRALSAQGWPRLTLSLPPPAPRPPLLLRRRRLLLLLLLPLLLLLLLLDPPLLLLLLVPAGRANTLFSTSSVAAWACASTVMPSWPNGAGRTMRARCSSPARRVGETWHRLRPRPLGTERRRRLGLGPAKPELELMPTPESSLRLRPTLTQVLECLVGAPANRLDASQHTSGLRGPPACSEGDAAEAQLQLPRTRARARTGTRTPDPKP